jgi:hypothetical protein
VTSDGPETIEWTPGGRPSIEWALRHCRRFVRGELTTRQYCAPVNDLVDWTHTLPEDYDVSPDLMWYCAMYMASTCIGIWPYDEGVGEARAGARELLSILEQGEDVWAAGLHLEYEGARVEMNTHGTTESEV